MCLYFNQFALWCKQLENRFDTLIVTKEGLILYFTEINFDEINFLLKIISAKKIYTPLFQDATANDIPRETFEVQGYPTVYFRSASGKISQYDGSRTKEDIIDFIEKNRDKADQQESVKDEL